MNTPFGTPELNPFKSPLIPTPNKPGFPYFDFDSDKDLLPQTPQFQKLQTSGVYIVMQTNVDPLYRGGDHPLSVHESYEDAKKEVSMKPNTHIVGPIPYLKSSSLTPF